MCAEMRVIMELKITDLKKTYGNVKALKGISYTFTPVSYTHLITELRLIE